VTECPGLLRSTQHDQRMVNTPQVDGDLLPRLAVIGGTPEVAVAQPGDHLARLRCEQGIRHEVERLRQPAPQLLPGLARAPPEDERLRDAPVAVRLARARRDGRVPRLRVLRVRADRPAVAAIKPLARDLPRAARVPADRRPAARAALVD